MSSRTIGRILIVDDDEDVLQAARILLKQHGHTIRTESNPAAIPEILEREEFDVILLDMNFTGDSSTGAEGFHWLDRILKIDPAAVVILITAFGDVEMAVQAIRHGATDFVQKPWQNEKLLATIMAGMKLHRSRLEVASLKSREKYLSGELDQNFHNFIGESPAIRQVFASITKVAATDANILILGENGTGKELVAREIHRQSLRADNVFISVDMGAIAETLFESELFGHARGAFTDARQSRAGRFEMAAGGTLFLDEIGNLQLPLQAKLLAVLENRAITRVGSNNTTPIDIRLICATNKPIHEMVAEDCFREDLLYRIDTVEIKLPPLRARLEDIPLLAEHFLEIYRRKYQKNIRSIRSSTLTRLAKYHWPGNIRELQHAVERAVIMTEAEELRPEDFFLTASRGRKNKLAVDSYNLDDIEKEVILKALEKHSGNVSHAAKELGITRASLYRRLQKHDL